MSHATLGLGGLIASIYENMLVLGDWRDLMIAIRARLNVPMIYLRVIQGDRDWTGSLGYPKQYDRLYESRYRRADLLDQRASAFPSMQPLLLANLSRDPLVERSGHYREIIRPLGIEHILTARGHSAEREVAFSIARCADETPFDEGDMDTFRTFAESFSRASRLHERIARGLAGPSAPETGRLRHRYALTRRQADVAVEVAKGTSTDAIAERLGVGREAIRAHLKAIYRKTETHSRAELVYRLLTVAGPAN